MVLQDGAQGLVALDAAALLPTSPVIMSVSVAQTCGCVTKPMIPEAFAASDQP